MGGDETRDQTGFGVLVSHLLAMPVFVRSDDVRPVWEEISFANTLRASFLTNYTKREYLLENCLTLLVCYQ